jgi:two-component system, chemotaxis family, protein-glutamate methylesterase/glutaminase
MGPDHRSDSEAKEKVRVLIVDDSSFVRKALMRIFGSDPSFDVVGAAGSGMEALEKIAVLNPDVITLDILMPGMDGLETLKVIMESRPTPVLMLSQLTQQGTELTLRALELGAMDFVDKSSAGIMDFFDLAREIRMKVHSIAGGRPLKIGGGADILPSTSGAGGRGGVDVVAIGASTGGPVALQMLLPKFPRGINFSILVVQHMPRGFTRPLAKRFDTLCDIPVREAGEGDPVRSGEVLIAPAGLHMTVRRTTGRTAVTLALEPEGEIHRPSIDVLFESVARSFGRRAVGVILTGMGSDGAEGLKAIKEEGGLAIAQDEATSAIFGMPRAAAEKGAVDKMLPLNSIAEEILKKA